MRSERWGPPPGRGKMGRGRCPGLPGLWCQPTVVLRMLARGTPPVPPLPPGAGSDLPFLPLAPTSPCSFPSHQSCGHPGLRRSSPHSLINDGERGEGGGEAQGRQPWRGLWLSPAHGQPGLQEALLEAETPQKAVQQPASCSLPRGTWPVQRDLSDQLRFYIP